MRFTGSLRRAGRPAGCWSSGCRHRGRRGRAPRPGRQIGRRPTGRWATSQARPARNDEPPSAAVQDPDGDHTSCTGLGARTAAVPVPPATARDDESPSSSGSDDDHGDEDFRG